MKVFIIAEAGVNHNGREDLAFKLIDSAADAGADAVKFQTFRAENLVTGSAGKAEYQKVTTDRDETQLAMLKRLELPYPLHKELMLYARKKGIQFLSTPFDRQSLDFLVDDLGIEVIKIPSGEITNGPLLLAGARKGRDIILSTGMATLGEIEEALGVIAFGFSGGTVPDRSAFMQAFGSPESQSMLQNKVTLLHCTTEYPASPEDINLGAIETLGKAFRLKTGLSDHSEGITIPLAAAAMGAKVIEKHFTLDKSLEGPDHQASLDPDELREMVSGIRTIEKAFGDGVKVPKVSELGNKAVARKSIVAKIDISRGDVFSEKNLCIKRPGTGLSPMMFWDLLGRESKKDYRADEVLT